MCKIFLKNFKWNSGVLNYFFFYEFMIVFWKKNFIRNYVMILVFEVLMMFGVSEKWGYLLCRESYLEGLIKEGKIYIVVYFYKSC